MVQSLLHSEWSGNSKDLVRWLDVTQEHSESLIEELLRQMILMREDLKEIRREVAVLKDGDISQMKISIAMLQVKAGVWGILGGLVPVLIYMTIELLRK